MTAQRLQSRRQGQNPTIRNQRRQNGHVRSQAPNPNAQIQQPGGQAQPGPDDNQLSPQMDSLLSRVDVMRQATPSVSLASGGRGNSGGSQGAPTQPGPPLSKEDAQALEVGRELMRKKMMQLLAMQEHVKNNGKQ